MHQPHRVIDPQAAGMTQRSPHRGDERFEARVDERHGRDGHQAPVLAGRHVDIRWRADAEAGQEVAGPCPGMAAGRVHADGKICNQADAHARIAGAGLRTGEGNRGKPLQELVIEHLLR